MTQKDVKKTRNIGIVGHGGAGKTSLVEHWLFETGAMTRLGRIEDKNTVSDFLDEERERGNSISLSLVHVKHRDHLIQIIDTPGYADFIGEVVAAVPVVEAEDRGSPAWKAGLRPGDIILEVNGEAISNKDDTQLVLGTMPVGTVVTMVVDRAGEEKTITFTPEAK